MYSLNACRATAKTHLMSKNITLNAKNFVAKGASLVHGARRIIGTNRQLLIVFKILLTYLDPSYDGHFHLLILLCRWIQGCAATFPLLWLRISYLYYIVIVVHYRISLLTISIVINIY